MPEEDAYTRAQIALYGRMSTRVAASLPYSVIRHTACLLYTSMDMFAESEKGVPAQFFE